MSGIFGLLALDGRARPIEGLQPMADELARRGPDGTRVWQHANVVLGQASLATTPEAMVEVLPLTDTDTGCTITADCRLDNREELIAALDLSRADHVIGDGELILRAYLQWGENCPAKLLGDFAFAIWDPRRERLFCARDHMGMRQFNYCHVPGQIFVFATEDTAVLAHPEVPRELDEGHIADFIADLECVDLTSTFFKTIHRLPPAHWLSVTSRCSEVGRYWTLQPEPLLRLETDEAYAEAFLRVFTEAVQCRLRASTYVATMLSGGLDSSAVASVSAEILSAEQRGPLHAISAVGPDPTQCAETRAIYSVQTMAGISPLFVTLDDMNCIHQELIDALKYPKNPFELNGTMLRSVYAAARKKGINVVLDGGSGDVILIAENRISSLLAAFQPRRAIRELLAERQLWQPEKPIRFILSRFLSAVWVAFAPLSVRSLWRRLRVSGQIEGASPKFVKRVGFANRRLWASEHRRLVAPSDPFWRVDAILHPDLVAGRERYDQLAGSWGIEPRDPFMDIRVIAFCLSLPPEQIQSDGWRKVILRRLLEKRVSKDIAWRRDKEHLGWTFTKTLLSYWQNWTASMREPCSPIREYLAPATLECLRNDEDHTPTEQKLRFLALDRFLRRYGRQHSEIS